MRTSRIRLLSVALMAVLLPVGMLGAYVLCAPSMQELSAQGDGFVDAIERICADHGRYPDSAAEAGVGLPTTRYGPWRYRVSEDRASFELSVGDYEGLDPFTLSWSSEAGAWSQDR